MDLADFILERLADDEHTASTAYSLEGGPGLWLMAGPEGENLLMMTRERALREIEAKRSMVRAYQTAAQADTAEGVRAGAYAAHSETLVDLASVYMDHEDFDPRWGV